MPPKPQESNGALNPQKQFISRELIEAELKRLEGEYQKCFRLIQVSETDLNCRRSDMLMIRGAIATLQAIFKESDTATAKAG